MSTTAIREPQYDWWSIASTTVYAGVLLVYQILVLIEFGPTTGTTHYLNFEHTAVWYPIASGVALLFFLGTELTYNYRRKRGTILSRTSIQLRDTGAMAIFYVATFISITVLLITHATLADCPTQPCVDQSEDEANLQFVMVYIIALIPFHFLFTTWGLSSMILPLAELRHALKLESTKGQ